MQLLPHTLSTKFGLASKPDKGWFDDLPGGAAGQRIVVPPQAAITVVAYVGTSPQTDPCLTGQTANIYAREFATGATVLGILVSATGLTSSSASSGWRSHAIAAMRPITATSAAGCCIAW